MRTRLGPDFAKLWTASTVSNLGDGVTLVAGPLLAASLTRDPLLVAALTFAQRLPWLLFSLLSGALVDRLDRRRVMVSADLFRAVVIGLLGVVVLLDAASIPLLCTTLFLLGTAETLFDTASISILPAMVPKASLTKANGRLLGRSSSRRFQAGSGCSGRREWSAPRSAPTSPKGCAGWPATSCCGSSAWPSA